MSDSKKKITIGYWVLTLMFVVPLGLSGVGTVLKIEQLAANYTALEYPLYMMTIVGTAKILGVLSILQPKFNTLKEWAYAGFTVNLLGASLSHLLHGDEVPTIVIPLVVLSIVFGSYIMWKKRMAASV